MPKSLGKRPRSGRRRDRAGYCVAEIQQCRCGIGVPGERDLRARGTEGYASRRGGGHLRAREGAKQVQGVRGRGHLRAREGAASARSAGEEASASSAEAKSSVQGVRSSASLCEIAKQVQGVLGRGICEHGRELSASARSAGAHRSASTGGGEASCARTVRQRLALRPLGCPHPLRLRAQRVEPRVQAWGPVVVRSGRRPRRRRSSNVKPEPLRRARPGAHRAVTPPDEKRIASSFSRARRHWRKLFYEREYRSAVTHPDPPPAAAAVQRSAPRASAREHEARVRVLAGQPSSPSHSRRSAPP